MIEEKIVVIASHKAYKTIDEIQSFGYKLAASKNLTLAQALKIDRGVVHEKNDRFFTELIFTREEDADKYSAIKALEDEYFEIQDKAVPLSENADLFVGICAVTVIGWLILPFALSLRRKIRKNAQRISEENASNDNIRKSLVQQAEDALYRNQTV